jgi:uncharacterized damage-inducible protein DinB
MTLPDHFRTLQRYETWANDLAIASLESVPQASRGGTQFVRAVQVLAHNQLARKVWLARIHGRTEKVEDWFPLWSIPELRKACAEADASWSAFLGTLQEADLARAVRYSSSEGTGYESTLAEILTHVYNHSTYHRGQVARLVSEAGGKRAATDFIGMSRRPAAH